MNAGEVKAGRAHCLGVLAAVTAVTVAMAGCGGGKEGNGGGAGRRATGAGATASKPQVVIGADGRPITGAIAAPKPAAVSDRATGAYLRGFDECALADEAVAPANTEPVLIDRGGRYEEAEFRIERSSLKAERSNGLGSDLWVYRTDRDAQAALVELKTAVAGMTGVSAGRVQRALYATRGQGVEPGLRACTERAAAAEAAVAAPDQVQRLTAAEEEFVRGPASDLGGWCYQASMRTGNPGSTVSGAKRTARKLEALYRSKPDAQTSGGTSVREKVAEVAQGLTGYDGCPVSSVGDELSEALK